MATSQNPGFSSWQQATQKLEQIALSITPILQAIDSNQVYFVGGAVRDALQGLDPTDIDLTCDVTPGELFKRLSEKCIRVIGTGLEHGTVTAVLDQQLSVEITTFRKATSRNKFVTGASLEEDLAGRDFTINAIAWSPLTKSAVDPYDGANDLKAGILRSVGKAEDRFNEDPLRILRMIRFGPAARREITTELMSAATNLGPQLRQVSVERIKSELDGILMAEDPAAAFRCMLKLGLLPLTIPELIPAVGFEQNDFHIHDVFEHTMWVLERSAADLSVRWAALFHDVGKPHTLSVDERGRRHFFKHELVSETQARMRLRELKASNDQIAVVSLLVKQHMRPLNCGAPGVRRIMRDLDAELPRWLLLKQADASPTIPEPEFKAELSHFEEIVETEKKRLNGPIYGKLSVNGEDLKALGIAPGPAMGAILKALEEIVLDDPELNQKELLLERARLAGLISPG